MKRAMSTVKNIAAAAMTLAVVFGFAGFKPVTANAAQAAVSATASVEEENSYFEEDAYQRSFLTLVNNERAQAGLAPVALGDSSHNAAAMERAEELAVSYSYVRPNGQRDFTVLAENGISDVSIGENYMAGCSTPRCRNGSVDGYRFYPRAYPERRCYYCERWPLRRRRLQ